MEIQSESGLREAIRQVAYVNYCWQQGFRANGNWPEEFTGGSKQRAGSGSLNRKPCSNNHSEKYMNHNTYNYYL